MPEKEFSDLFWEGETTFTTDRNTREKHIMGKTPEYTDLSICGDIWNTTSTDIVCNGQCFYTIAAYRDRLSDPDTKENERSF